MSDAMKRACSPQVQRAFDAAYNKKNRRFTFGGMTVYIPVKASEDDIKALCASLMKGGSKVKVPAVLSSVRHELTQGDKTLPQGT